MTTQIYGCLTGGVGAGHFPQLARPEDGKRPLRPNVWQFHVTFAGEEVTCYTTDRALARALSQRRVPQPTRCMRLHGRFDDITGRNPGFYVQDVEDISPGHPTSTADAHDLLDAA